MTTVAYRNFAQVLRGLDVSTAVAELARQPELWHEFTARQTYPGSAHHDTECIVLRGPNPDSTISVFDDCDSVAWPALELLPECTRLVIRLMDNQISLAVGRVMVVRLKPGGVIDPHVDEGAYADVYSRFHIPLISGVGNAFTCGDETVTMLPGTAWRFDHKQRHHVHNDSPDWRTHLIVDLVPYHVEPR